MRICRQPSCSNARIAWRTSTGPPPSLIRRRETQRFEVPGHSGVHRPASARAIDQSWIRHCRWENWWSRPARWCAGVVCRACRRMSVCSVRYDSTNATDDRRLVIGQAAAGWPQPDRSRSIGLAHSRLLRRYLVPKPTGSFRVAFPDNEGQARSIFSACAIRSAKHAANRLRSSFPLCVSTSSNPLTQGSMARLRRSSRPSPVHHPGVPRSRPRSHPVAPP